VPLGAYAVCDCENMSITGFVASVDGTQMLVETANGSRNDAEALGKKLASKLIAHGADKILAAL
jgi:hydroxymethylbilane synthase